MPKKPKRRPKGRARRATGTAIASAATGLETARFWGAKVKITVRVTVEEHAPAFEDALHIGFMGPGAWYDPSFEDVVPYVEKRFKALRYSGPHYLTVYTTGLSDDVVRRHDRTVQVKGRDRSISVTLK
jgi:hypothetical protein